MKGLQKKHRSHDEIYRLVDAVHTRGQEKLQSTHVAHIQILIESGIQSPNGLRRALECGDFELADYLWKHKSTLGCGDLTNLCSSLRAIQWAHERNLPFNEEAIIFVVNIWNGDEVHDRLLYLFQECGVRVINNTIWDRIKIRGVAYLGFRWCTPCQELCKLVERTCDLGAFHICFSKGMSIDIYACIGGLTSYEELITLCHYQDMYIRDIFVRVLLSKDINDSVLQSIIRGVFNICRKGDFYVNLCEQNDLFEILVKHDHMKAAKTLGRLLSDPGLDAKKRKTVQVDWKRWVDRVIYERFGNCDRDEGDEIYCDWINKYLKFKIIDPIDHIYLMNIIQTGKEEDDFLINLDADVEDTVRRCNMRRRVVLCLCATRFDRGSYFKLLPYSLVQWMMKTLFRQLF